MTAHQSNLVGLLIIVDASRLPPITNGRLAAYLTMIALSGAERSDMRLFGIDSAFNALQPGETAPFTGARLTGWDKSLLRALYRPQGNVPIALFRGQVLSRLGPSKGD